ncbi:Hypothetical protein FKW44_002415 [Caligus rogercresseyi]|uniref:Uncharacterized protein n=1 Tax=Caligus rogercresseyi TaxID=217165 RepID=A0A7T8QWB4_CALRO|nr:Hypothetical protein FKW44_002415 [Caligus rogercresseyi]
MPQAAAPSRIRNTYASTITVLEPKPRSASRQTFANLSWLQKTQLPPAYNNPIAGGQHKQYRSSKSRTGFQFTLYR